MLYLIEHKSKKNIPKSAAIVSAFFQEHARDIYEFIVYIAEDDIVNIVEIAEDVIDMTIYVEINRYNEFVSMSREKLKPTQKGGIIKEIIVSDSITNLYQLTTLNGNP